MKRVTVTIGLAAAVVAAAAGAALGQVAKDAGKANGSAVADAVAAIESEYAGQYDDKTADILTEVTLALDAVKVMRLTVKFSPEIRRAYERRAAEESRYDFFIYNREAFSYGATTDFEYARDRDDFDRSVTRILSPQVFARKEFYNTASASLRAGYDLTDSPDEDGANAFVSATVSAPLFASREALERSNDKIYQQNKVNDARLEYYQQIRQQVEQSLESLCWAQRNKEALECLTCYRGDLEKMLETAASIADRDTSADASKIEATLASVRAEYESNANEFEISSERLRNVIGIPFDTAITVTGDDFDPFEGESREELERVAVETDEEIKTLLNSIRNAQSELELARKGKWDTTLYVSATRDFAGNNDREGTASYAVSTGVEVTHIDSRISRSLEAIALANIREYRNAIVDRHREIHTDIVEAFKNVKGLMAEVRARTENLSRYERDYAAGIELYRGGGITIDELIQKRQTIRNEHDAIAWSRHGARESMATLLAATGRYERYLDGLNGAPDSGSDEGADAAAG